MDVQQFGQLRSRIESTFVGPSMIVVTSAAYGDGKSVTAFGLAEALAEADHRVLFVDANVGSPALSRANFKAVPYARADAGDVSGYASVVAGQRFKGISLADERFESGLSMEKVKSIAGDLLEHFDYVIVDTAPCTRSNLAVLFSTLANGTMLTLRVGRMATAADDETMRILNRVGANIMGVLTVTPKVVKSFRERQVGTKPNVVLTPRHVTTRHSSGPDVAREISETPSRSKIVS